MAGFGNILVHTDLTSSKCFEVLNSTLGKMSDGIWENSTFNEGYWPFAEVEMIDGEIWIVISNERSKQIGRNTWRPNRFWDKYQFNEDKIRNFFANKVKAVVKTEMADNPDRGLKFSDKCNVKLEYMGGYEHDAEPITAADAYAVYKALKAV